MDPSDANRRSRGRERRSLVWRVLRAWLSAALLLTTVAWAFAPTANASPTDGLPELSEKLDRTTPQRSARGYLRAARTGDFTRAAHYLDLRSVPKSERAERGPEIARKLAYVLERRVDLDLEELPDTHDAEGKTASFGTAFVADRPVSIRLARVRFEDGVERWLVARASVDQALDLYEAVEPSWIAKRVPVGFWRATFLGNETWQWLGLMILALVAVIGGRIIGRIAASTGAWAARRRRHMKTVEVILAARRPVQWILAGITFRASLDVLHLSTDVARAANFVAFSTIVVGGARAVIAALGALTKGIEEQAISDSRPSMMQDALEKRTQVTVLRRVASAIVIVMAGATILLQFDFVRDVGLSLLASAGVAGIVLGLAAQKSLGGVIAGIQLALSEAVRMGDTVRIEGELGVVEEIYLTYAIVHLWDGRRLVVPVARFVDQPFENWTMVNPELFGPVFMHVDPAAPIDRLRQALTDYCEEHPLWDKRLCRLVVFETTPDTLQLRALVSAKNPSQCFDLRCDVREFLARYLADLEGGRYVVRRRIEMHDDVAPKRDAN